MTILRDPYERGNFEARSAIYYEKVVLSFEQKSLTDCMKSSVGAESEREYKKYKIAHG